MTVKIANNVVSNVGQYGIYVAAVDGNGTMNATIINNSVTMTAPGSLQPIRINNGALSTDSTVMNLDISGNTATSTVAGMESIRIHRSGLPTSATSVGRLEDYAGNANSETDIEAYLVARNDPGFTANVTSAGASGLGWTNINDVPEPPAPLMAAAAPPAEAEQAEEDLPEQFVDTPQVTIGDSSGESGTEQDGGSLAPAQPGAPVVIDDGILSQAELDLIVAAAIERWAAAGATEEQLAAMRAVTISVADLGGLQLGESGAGSITVDSDAAGWRWFIDATPGEDSEYAGAGTTLVAVDANGVAGTRIDLLTVITHELGHQIGLSDSYATEDEGALMYGTIGAGQRRIPGAEEVSEATGTAVTGAYAIAPLGLGTIPAGRTVTVEWRSMVDSPAEDGLVGAVKGQSTLTSTPTGTSLSNAELTAIDGLSLGNLVFLDVNKDGNFDAGTDTGIAGVVLTLFADTNNDGDFDEGVDLYVGYNELGGGGGYQPGVDTVAAGGTGTALTATTDANGAYVFNNLAPGDYIVRVDAANFTGAGALVGKVTIAGASADPNLNADGDDNGDAFTGYVATKSIRLDYGLETVAGPTGTANDTNDTLDLGFLALNKAPVNTLPAPFNVNEDSVAAPVAGVSVSDPEADPAVDKIQVKLDVTNGTMTVATNVVGGIVDADITGGANGSATITILATQNQINATLAAASGLTFTPTANYNGPADLTVTTNDKGFSGVDPGLTGDANSEEDTDTVAITVLSVNDAPTGAVSSVLASEDDTYVFASSDFGFSDPIENNAFFSVILDNGAGQGQLLFDGNPVTAGQTILVSDIDLGKLTFVPAPDTYGNNYASFTFQVVDDGGTANGGVDTDPTPRSMTINVNPDNLRPVIDLNGGDAGIDNGASYTENGSAVVLASGLTLADDDGTGQLSSAAVSIGTGFIASQDLLTINGATSGTSGFGQITFSYNATTGVMTLSSSGPQPFFFWEDALRRVAFSSTSEEPGTSRSISWTVNDGLDPNLPLSVTAVAVTPVNDAPSGANATLAATEDVPYVFATADFGFTDVDADALSGVRINAAPVGGTLFFDADGAGGTDPVQVTAFPTIFYAATDIAAGKLTFVPTLNLNGAGAGSVEFVVQDDGGIANGGVDTAASSNTLTFDIAAANDAPVVTASAGTAAFVEGVNVTSTPVAIDPALTLADVDNATLSSATVAITANHAAGEDVLSFAPGAAFGNISGSYNATTGVLTLTSSGGTATLAEWQAALQSVTYTNSSEEPSTATRTVSFTVNDGVASSNAGTRDVTVAALNDAPTGTDQTVGINEDATHVITTANLGFVDVDGDAFSSVRFSAPVGGTLFYDADGAGGADPVAVTDYTTVYTAADIAAGKLTFRPALNLNGTGAASIGFVVQDDGGTAGGGVDSDPTANTLTFDIAAVNDAPVLTASAGTAAFVEGVNVTSTPVAVDPGLTLVDVDDTAFASATVAITGNFAAAEDLLSFTPGAAFGDIAGSYNATTGVLSLTSAGGASLAEWQAALQSVTYTNGSEEPSTATRTVSFTINDGAADSNVATRDVTVAARNDAPTGTDSVVGINEDTAHVITTANLGFVDVDGDAFSSVRFSAPVGGTLFYDADGAGGNAPVAVTNLTTVYTAQEIADGKLSFVPTLNLNGRARPRSRSRCRTMAAQRAVARTRTRAPTR